MSYKALTAVAAVALCLGFISTDAFAFRGGGVRAGGVRVGGVGVGRVGVGGVGVNRGGVAWRGGVNRGGVAWRSGPYRSVWVRPGVGVGVGAAAVGAAAVGAAAAAPYYNYYNGGPCGYAPYPPCR
jgi:hypothetical protein